MKLGKLFTCLALVNLGVVAAAEPVQLDAQGRLKVADMVFSGNVFVQHRDLMQGSRHWQVQPREKQAASGVWRRSGKLNISKTQALPFKVELKKVSPRVFLYELKIQGIRTLNKSYPFTFRTPLPAKIYGQRQFKFDQKIFVPPATKKKLNAFQGDCKSVALPVKNGFVTLTSPRKMMTRLHDYRPVAPAFNLLLGLSTPATQADCKVIQLKIELPDNQ